MADTAWADGLRERHTAKAAALAEEAAADSAHALSNAAVGAGIAAVRRVMPDTGKGGIREAASDAAAILADPIVAQRLSADLRAEAIAIRSALGDAVVAGYEAEGDEQHVKLWADSKGAIGLHLTVSDADRQALGQFPIAGHGADDWTRSLVARLRTSFEGALVQALDQADPDGAVPAAVADVQRQHGDRVASTVREAFWAGTRAANRDIQAAARGH